VQGDPVNNNDPNGLCSVLISGVTMGPGSNAAWTQEAQTLGADTAYPYQGQDLPTSVASVLAQSLWSNASTWAAYQAITQSIASSGGPVDIVAYSGGAAAFTAAYGMLSSWQQSMIGNILYISPGAATQVATNGSTTAVLGSGVVDRLATFGTQVPFGVPIVDSSCAHTDLACLFNAAAPQLARIQNDGSCSSPEVYTRMMPFGVPGIGVPGPVPGPGKGGGSGSYWSLPSIAIFIPSDPTPVVTASITFDSVN
jgi:hypothetical protein